MLFRDQAFALYTLRQHHILPFIGTAFDGGRPDLLRAVVVGINTYVSPKDWDPSRGKPAADWFPRWFATTEHRFGKRVHAESLQLLRALTAQQSFHPGKIVSWPDSFYATNAIKVHVREAEGKRADQVGDSVFEEHVATWHAELDLMAEHGVLPHVIVIFGKPFWSRACASFRLPQAQSYRHLGVLSYESFPEPCLHFLNRLRLQDGRGEQDTVLIRIRHPSARTNVGSAKWLLAQESFRALLSPC